MQYTELLRCIKENPDDFAAALQGLGVPPHVHRMAWTHPECEHLATLPPDLLWRLGGRHGMQLNAKLIRYFLRAKYRSSGGVSVLVVPIVYLMCPLKAAQMGTTSTQQVEETQAAFAQGKIFTECLCDFTRGGASAVPWQLYYT